MKKIFGFITVLALFSFTPVSNLSQSGLLDETITNHEVLATDCDDLGQGYYEYLVNEEGVGHREAGRRARALRDACEEVSEN